MPADIADPQDVSFRWYFYNGTEYELLVGVNHTRLGGSGGLVEVTSTLHISGISQNTAHLSEGFYYCQVQLIDTNVVSNLSQRFQVWSEDDYIQYATSCSEKTFIDMMEMCAVYRVTEEPPTTTPETFMATTAPRTQDKEATAAPLTDVFQSTDSLSTSAVNISGTMLETWIYVFNWSGSCLCYSYHLAYHMCKPAIVSSRLRRLKVENIDRKLCLLM